MWKFSEFNPATFQPRARDVTRVFVHCTDSDADTEEYRGPRLATTIDEWHKAPPRNWAGIGYHFVVDKAGAISTGRPLEIAPAAQLGADGRGNVATIAISTQGSKEWPSAALAGTLALVSAIDAAYVALGRPVTIWGHTEIDPRPCPVYDWRALFGLDAARRFGAGSFTTPEDLAAGGKAPRNGKKPPAGTPEAAAWARLPIIDPPHPTVGARLLFDGCHGDDVVFLQRALAKAGFDPGGSDGWFGGNTYRALAAFQRAKRLDPDGIAGPTTKRALGL